MTGQVQILSKKPQPFLELREVGSFDVHCIPLESGRQVMGRSPDLAVTLPHISVSRYHAELVEDPYQRWWIHDLGSTNGTYVNGTRITQRLLNAGDTIQAGDYVLRFRFPGTVGDHVSQVTEPPSARQQRAPSTKRLLSVDTTRVGAAQLASAAEFSRSLMQLDKKRERLGALLDHCVYESFPGLSAWVMRVRRDMLPKLYLGPLHRASIGQVGSPRHQAEIEAFCGGHEATLYESPGPHLFQLDGVAHFIACAVDTEPDGMHVLYVETPEHAQSEDWQALLALLTDAYQQANEICEMREHVRYTAVVNRELEMARQIQERFVPTAPDVRGLEVAIGYEPCQWVGGDYVDSLELADGRVLLVCADVCGKGLQASLVASSLHTLVHSLVETESDLDRVVVRINKYLCRFLPEHSFVTFVCLAIDPVTGDLECVNAGHPPALLVSSRGVERLQTGVNSALGIAELSIQSERRRLALGDMLLLYSDGVTEAEDAERQPLGEERLMNEFQRIVVSMNDARMQTVLESLSHTVSVHRGSLMAADDTTFLVARWIGDDAPSSGITTQIPEPV